MLLNPSRPEAQRYLACLPGTRILQATLGLLGTSIKDPFNLARSWTLECFYAPIRGRAIGGVRARLVDNLGFTTFCNQRDLEVLLELAKPGNWCQWLDEYYVGHQEPDWIGFAVDDNDLSDDLYDREIFLRGQYPSGTILPVDSEIRRLIHDGPHRDYEELLQITYDMDHDTGYGPDDRFQTLDNRWRSVERTTARERERLWFSRYQNSSSLISNG